MYHATRISCLNLHCNAKISEFKRLMRKILLFSFLITLIQACSFPGVFKINVQQGNIVSEEMLDKLEPGMTRKQVHFVLGAPVVDNVFNLNLENYVYTYQKAGGEIKQQTVKVYYKDSLYSHYTADLLEETPAY